MLCNVTITCLIRLIACWLLLLTKASPSFYHLISQAGAVVSNASASSLSSTNRPTTGRDYSEVFYNISMHHRRSNTSSFASLTKIHLLRVPKASSSSLSAVARRAVGCTPIGPCCKWPGDPPGNACAALQLKCLYQ